MNDQLPDRTVLLIILATLLLVFFLVFSFKSEKIEQEKTIQQEQESKQIEEKSLLIANSLLPHLILLLNNLEMSQYSISHQPE